MRNVLTYPLILFMVIFLQVSGVILCPTECRCGQRQAHCSGLPVNKIEQIPSYVTVLIIQDNDLSSLQPQSLSHLSNLERLELFNNRLTSISTEMLSSLSNLKYLRVEQNRINCDCNMVDLNQYLKAKGVRVQITCDAPQELRGRNLNDIRDTDLNCDYDDYEYADDSSLDHAFPLATVDSHMFKCHVSDNINVDIFQTANDDKEQQETFETIEIQNFASNIYGKHDCTLKNRISGLETKEIKLVITQEANSQSDINVNSQFKAEILTKTRVDSRLPSNEKLMLHCPKSGDFECMGEHAKQPDKDRPKFVTEPIDIDAFVGTTIELPCQGEGQPPPEVKWKKDGKTLIPSAKHRFASTGSLFIKKVTAQDAGRYECSIKSEFGRDSASALVTVKDKDTLAPNEATIRIAFSDATRDVDAAINQTIASLFQPNSKKPRHHGDLFSIIRYPKGDTRELARAAEIYERTIVNIRKQIDGGAMMHADVEQFNYHDILSQEHLELIAQLSGCMAHRIIPNCTHNMCFHMKYRSIDGTCNNLEHTSWGASLTGFRRIAKPIYENGFSTPIGWIKGKLYNGFPKPSARLVSTKVISTNTITQDDKITHMVMQWGQFLDHDLDHAIPSVSSESWDGVDCKKTCENTAPCYPIQVPPNDPRVTNRRCIDLFRSSAICGSGMTSVLFETIQPREQINQLTAYIDASQVYGFSRQFARDLRNLTTDDGLLRTGVHFPKQKSMLPFQSPTDGIDCRRNVEESNINCFAAGDIRVNEQIGLTAMHTIWLREHNRLATALKAINFHWDGETLYQEARKIVGAEMQAITWEHWLPIVLGPEGMQKLGPYPGYDPTVDVSISNEFATAALRFGHTLINPILHRLNESFQPIPEGHLELHKAFFAPWRLVYEGGVDPLMRGLYSVPAKLKLPRENLNIELTEKLFFNAHAVALDLAAINIQRARDHGIPGYNEYRKKCNLPEAHTFDDLRYEISNDEVRSKLKELYGHPGNIDLFVGGILEDKVEGGKIGPTFRCILMDQFDRFRRGDRHWYENPSAFKPEQLSQIKMASLGRVLCDNGDNITKITKNVFFLPATQGGYKDCSEIPKINLNVWLNCDKCNKDRDPNTNDVDPTLPRERGIVSRRRRSVDESPVVETFNNSTVGDYDDSFTKLTEYEKKIQDLSAMITNMQNSIDETQRRLDRLESNQQSCVDSFGKQRMNGDKWFLNPETACTCLNGAISCETIANF